MRPSVCFQSVLKESMALKIKFHQTVPLIAKNTNIEYKQNLPVSNKIPFTGVSVKNIFV